MYENTEPWDKDVPTDLIPAIKHLRKSFDKAHWGCGGTTKVFCYSWLHNEPRDDPRKEYLNYLMHMKASVGQAATHRFHNLLKDETLPAIFKAFFDLYLEGMSVQALLIFNELVEIGRANEKRLGAPHLEWAEAQVRHLIRSHYTTSGFGLKMCATNRFMTQMKTRTNGFSGENGKHHGS
jgi:hypothetical protein